MYGKCVFYDNDWSGQRGLKERVIRDEERRGKGAWFASGEGNGDRL